MPTEVALPSKLVRYPGDLAEKVRVLALVSGEAGTDILDRMTRKAVEREFADLPADVRKLARLKAE